MMPEQLVTPRLLSQKDAASYFGVSLRTVELWVATKEVSSVKLGTRRLIEKESLDAFIHRAARIPAKWEGDEPPPNSQALSFAQQVAAEVVRLMREAGT